MGIANPRQYTWEFKRQAAQLANELKSGAKAAEQLGIPKASIYTWRRQANAGVLGRGSSAVDTAKSQSATLSSSEEEIRRLQREVAELKKVNHVLKQAAAFFSQDHLK